MGNAQTDSGGAEIMGHRIEDLQAEIEAGVAELVAGEGKRGSARRVLRGFRVAHLFDITETEGDAVEGPVRPALLEGEAPAGLWDTLAGQIRNAGCTLVRSEIANGANGVTDFTHRTVIIAPHLSPAQACKTLAHELAHVSMHNGTEYSAGYRGTLGMTASSGAGEGPTGPTTPRRVRDSVRCETKRWTQSRLIRAGLRLARCVSGGEVGTQE